VRGATHVPDSPLGVAAAQADEAPENSRNGAGARQADRRDLASPQLD